MRLRLLRHALPAALLALASACQEEGSAPQVELLTTACAGTPPLENVTHLRLRITGAGLRAPIVKVTPVNLKQEDVPIVPPGTERVLEVRGYTGEPSSSGRLLAVGRSTPFEMPLTGAPVDPIRVILRRVETFVPVESAERPGSCLELTEPRAGHTATLLRDGRVVLAGGFRVNGEGAFETLGSVEILDPMARTLSHLPDPGPGAASRAFHTAALTLDGHVLWAGGERAVEGVPTPLRSAAVFNPETGTAQGFELALARSRHAAAADNTGRVLLVGGVGEGGGLVMEPEGVEPLGRRSFPVPTALPRLGVSALPVQDGQRIGVIGGSDETHLAAQVLTFAFNGTTFVPSDTALALRLPRRNAAVVPYPDGQRLLVVGGYGDPEAPEINGRALAASEILDFGGGVSVGPSLVARGDVCAAALGDGRVLVSGGRRQRPGDFKLSSNEFVELVVPTESPTAGVLGMQPLAPARYLHTCTPLPDGSVLVTGGLDDSLFPDNPESPPPPSQVSSDAFIFMPVPRD